MTKSALLSLLWERVFTGLNVWMYGNKIPQEIYEYDIFREKIESWTKEVYELIPKKKINEKM